MPSPRELTELHRRRQLALRDATVRQVAAVWPLMRWDALDESFRKFLSAVGQVVAANRRTSVGLTSA